MDLEPNTTLVADGSTLPPRPPRLRGPVTPGGTTPAPGAASPGSTVSDAVLWDRTGSLPSEDRADALCCILRGGLQISEQHSSAEIVEYVHDHCRASHED